MILFIHKHQHIPVLNKTIHIDFLNKNQIVEVFDILYLEIHNQDSNYKIDLNVKPMAL